MKQIMTFPLFDKSRLLSDFWDSGRSGTMVCYPWLCLRKQAIFPNPPLPDSHESNRISHSCRPRDHSIYEYCCDP